MSTRPTPNADDAVREELVAYLDGELSPEEAQSVEQRLSGDKRYQEEMQSLDKAWNALDELPRASVDEGFSKTTIEMATIEARREVTELTTALPVQRRRVRLGLVAAGFFALLAGFVLARSAATSQDRKLINNLPVVWQVEALSQTPDLEFLSLLIEKQPELLTQHSSEEVKRLANAWGAIEAESVRERSKRVKNLSDSDRVRLFTASQQFESMSSSRKEALREKNTAIVESKQPTPQQLRRAAVAYATWLNGQTPVVQSELRTLPTNKDRLARIQSIRRREISDSFRKLSQQNASVLLDATRKAAESESVLQLMVLLQENWQSNILRMEERGDGSGRFKGAIRRMREGAKRFQNAADSFPPLRVLTAARAAHPPDQRARFLVGGHREATQQAWREIEPTLLAALPEKQRIAMEKQPKDRRSLRLQRWITEAMAAAFQEDNVDDFFASDMLSDSERNELLALPRDAMYARLRAYYVERQLGGIDPRTLNEFAPLLRNPNGRRGGPRVRPRRPNAPPN